MDTKNIIAAISLSAAVIILYGLFFAPEPRPIDQKKLIEDKNKIVQDPEAPSLEQNEEVLKMAVKFGLSINASINSPTLFARKNYFYPDLPKGYQISQYELPLATGGHLSLHESGTDVGITRIHLEEDAGKSLHEGFPDSNLKSHVDFNRSGVPLIEVVTEPDMRSATDAKSFFATLREILVSLDVNDGNMEEGSFRCDANVSLRQKYTSKLGTRTEI